MHAVIARYFSSHGMFPPPRSVSIKARLFNVIFVLFKLNRERKEKVTDFILYERILYERLNARSKVICFRDISKAQKNYSVLCVPGNIGRIWSVVSFAEGSIWSLLEIRIFCIWDGDGIVEIIVHLRNEKVFESIYFSPKIRNWEIERKIERWKFVLFKLE